MGILRSWTKRAFEGVSGCRIALLGGRSLVLTDRRRPTDGWFLLPLQLRSVLERLGVDLVLDVGANVGQFGVRLRSFYAGPIISYEPVSATYRQLQAAAAGDPQWRVRNFALGRHSTSQTINVSSATEFSSLLRANDYCVETYGAHSAGTQEEVVQVRRLDEAVAVDVPDIAARRLFVKIDTQGYDLEVFRGMGTVLDHVVALLSEVSLRPIYAGMPHWTESITAYEEAGFSVAGLFPVAWDKDLIVEYDCLLVRREHSG